MIRIQKQKVINDVAMYSLVREEVLARDMTKEDAERLAVS